MDEGTGESQSGVDGVIPGANTVGGINPGVNVGNNLNRGAGRLVDGQPEPELPNSPHDNGGRLAHTGLSNVQSAQWLAVIAAVLGLACLSARKVAFGRDS
ncbi:hypothetical protein ABT187_49625 [Streptomyces sp. NPDC001817]|uniref:hypothetical protein n=1 Tax=Streptomyces sp. NPDC001817 TaxID=3154398 RepID=UPI0033308797